jgi:hypothetical protein
MYPEKQKNKTQPPCFRAPRNVWRGLTGTPVYGLWESSRRAGPHRSCNGCVWCVCVPRFLRHIRVKRERACLAKSSRLLADLCRSRDWQCQENRSGKQERPSVAQGDPRAPLPRVFYCWNCFCVDLCVDCRVRQPSTAVQDKSLVLALDGVAGPSKSLLA